MVASKYVAAVGMVVIAVVAFVAGLYLSPIILPPAKESEDPIWDSIVERGTIRVGSSPDWPPYEYLNVTTGEFIGFEVELMETIAEELDLTVEWVSMSFDLIISEVQAKSIDLGISGFSVRADRLEVAQFTMYHSITEGQIIMLETKRDELGITEIDSLGDLDDLGISCGAQRGTTQHQELQEEAPGALEVYEDYIVALEDMERDALDSIYAETPITTEWIATAEEPIVVIYRRTYYAVAFVAHKDADILVENINSVLAEMIGAGEVELLKKKWRC